MILLDTSAVLPLLNANDPDHASANDLLRRHLDSAQFVTHNYVVVETTALLQRRFGMRGVRTFVERLLPSIEVFWIDQARHDRAMAALLASGRRGISFVDAVSFDLMRERGIIDAFAYDDDFLREGFTLLA